MSTLFAQRNFGARAARASALCLLALAAALFQAREARAQWTQPDASGNINSTNTGNVGIGTTTPAFPITIVKDQPGATAVAAFNRTDAAGAQAAFGASRTLDWSSKYLSFGVTAPSYGAPGLNDTAYIHSKGVPLKFGSESAHDILFFTNGITNTRMTITGGGNVGLGTSAPVSKLHVVGDITVTGNINAKYQDVAEWVPTTQKLAVGTVVVLDTGRDNHVLASHGAYDTRVAGVISAQPGLSLGEGGEGKVLVATTGRVKVKVDATRGAIKIGDLIVTSGAPGVAMRSEPVSVAGVQMHRPGTIIGKALESLANGTGEILVLLSLQ